MLTLSELTARHAGNGQVEWIGVRPARKAAMIEHSSVTVGLSGLEGEHRTRPGKRAVTLIQAEHLSVIASLSSNGLSGNLSSGGASSSADPVHPSRLRRNLVVNGINLLALKDRKFRIGGIGGAEFLGTGICAPCSRMETELGNGGYNAMRGHGGITAEVTKERQIQLGDEIVPLE